MTQDPILQWIDLFRRSERPIALTGAGISVASGLPTVTETWQGLPLATIFKKDFFENQPEKFYKCYFEMLLRWKNAPANPAHVALAKADVRIVTQNMDGLHQKAGSRHVLELNGNLGRLLCRHCEQRFDAHRLGDVMGVPECPTCGDILKPDIVLEGEEIKHFAIAVDWVGKSDLLLVVGTRMKMDPCNQLPVIAQRNNTPVIIVNRQAEIILPNLLKSPRTRDYSS